MAEITQPELAEILGVPARQIRRWIAAGFLALPIGVPDGMRAHLTLMMSSRHFAITVSRSTWTQRTASRGYGGVSRSSRKRWAGRDVRGVGGADR